jgi:hypothetical protein
MQKQVLTRWKDPVLRMLWLFSLAAPTCSGNLRLYGGPALSFKKGNGVRFDREF